MGFILLVIGIILFIVWANRIERGLNKTNETLERIEGLMATKSDNKKEKK